jgi:predicted AAA+ superfamily ATPase
MRFGGYPEVFGLGESDIRERLDEVSSSYLYKDVLLFDGIKKPDLVAKLLILLASQIGSEVSYNNLANKLQVSRATVEKYIDILEKAFVIFRLRAFARNQSRELVKSIKIYFFDLGMRNSLISNYNILDLRQDVGGLWENFCIVERLKMSHYKGDNRNRYFWRNYGQKEVDYIEEFDGQLMAYEFKWSDKEKYATPKEFINAYNIEAKKISRNNIWDFLG